MRVLDLDANVRSVERIQSGTVGNVQEPTNIEGVYTLKGRIAEGGMAVVYRATVDLDAFDYTRLYAYTQVRGQTHAERQQQAARLARTLAAERLDRDTVRTILKAHDIPLPQGEAAVKVAKNEMDPVRFEAEWHNLLCLKHPNVIQVFGGGSWLGRPYYAMELLEGIVDPDEIARSFPMAEKLKIVIEAGTGLAFLHENGLIHRDVKPDNFITCRAEDGGYTTRITDLGIAKTADGSPGLTQTSQMMGTPCYMPPEQVRSSRDVDARADIYALGASLYNIVLGVRPFHDKTTLFEIIASVSAGENPIPPKQHNPNLPDVIAAIIECAMAPDRDLRYPAMTDLVHDLQAYLGAEDPSFLASVYVKSSPGLAPTAVAPRPGQYRFERVPPRQPIPRTRTPSELALPDTVVGQPPRAKSLALVLGLGLLGAMGVVAMVVWLFATRREEARVDRDPVQPLAAPSREGKRARRETDALPMRQEPKQAPTRAAAAAPPRPRLRRATNTAVTGRWVPRRIPPVHLSAMRSNQGWLVTFQLKDDTVRELRYRVGATGPFKSSGQSSLMNMKTGMPRPNLTVVLPLSQPKTQIFVKLVDHQGGVTRPIALRFDPGREAVVSTKQVLQMTATSWVAFRDYGGRRLLYFTHLLSHGGAIREIRYSLDSPSLDRRFPLPPPSRDGRITGPIYIVVPATTREAFVQVVFADSTKSEVRSFKAR
jgi:serine/threonine protein kinase